MPWLRQALVGGPVNGLPTGSMVWFARTQVLGFDTDVVMYMWPEGSIISWLIFETSSGVVLRSGVMRCGLIHCGQANWILAKTASVAAMAGTVWRTSTPIISPSANPKA